MLTISWEIIADPAFKRRTVIMILRYLRRIRTRNMLMSHKIIM